MSDYIIKATNIKKYFGGVKALDGVNLEIKKGEIHCLAGENGCGKSTIINIISGFYTPDEGIIEIDGQQYDHMITEAKAFEARAAVAAGADEVDMAPPWAASSSTAAALTGKPRAASPGWWSPMPATTASALPGTWAPRPL